MIENFIDENWKQGKNYKMPWITLGSYSIQISWDLVEEPYWAKTNAAKLDSGEGKENINRRNCMMRWLISSNHVLKSKTMSIL